MIGQIIEEIESKPHLKPFLLLFSIGLILGLTVQASASIITYQYDANGRLIEATMIGSYFYKYEYDSNNNILSETIDQDTDGDGLNDSIEAAWGCLDPQDADSDEDGIPDGTEDFNHNGVHDAGETNPCKIDTDADGIQDGTELGYTLEILGSYTDQGVFQPDLDPAGVTSPLVQDTDGDGVSDGAEDLNKNGRWDLGETESSVVTGDYDRNGIVEFADLIIVHQLFSGQAVEGQLDIRADTDGNHKVDLTDGIMILKIIILQ